MSELMTSVRLGKCQGWANYGRLSREQIIAEYRKRAQYEKQEAEAILAATDDEFIVEQFRGIHAQRNLVRIEPKSKAGEQK